MNTDGKFFRGFLVYVLPSALILFFRGNTRFFRQKVFPLGFARRFEIDANDKRRAFIKVQFKIAAAKPFEQIGFRLITELFELLQSEFGDLVKIDPHTFVDSRQKCAIHLTENLLEALVQFLLARIAFQFPSKFRFVIISERFFNPHGNSFKKNSKINIIRLFSLFSLAEFE